ncbi:MAG: class I SAM-dependent methyltransferase [Candidatus Pristimantibacillus sp.]
MTDKTTPGFIMNQIRNGVRKKNNDAPLVELDSDKFLNLDIEEHSDIEINEIIKRLNANLKRLNHRITPNMPVAFLEPHLVSRYKILGKIIIPIRKLGARLFTKWYADVFTSQQKHLNHDIWYGINASLETINDQQRLISYLNNQLSYANEQVSIQKSESEVLNEKLNLLEARFMKSQTLDFNYSKFAEKFSASPEVVKSIYTQYIPHFAASDRVLDIGCGKGYFLELLQENGINGVGIDSDSKLVEICQSKGLSAINTDVIEYLNQAKDNSLGGIFMGHVIEHLPVNAKIEFLNLCLTKLSSTGILVIETPNTSSSYVMHNLYYLDPTHEKPLLPEGMKHLALVTGFSVVNSYLSGPIDESLASPIEYYNYSLILKKE